MEETEARRPRQGAGDTLAAFFEAFFGRAGARAELGVATCRLVLCSLALLRLLLLHHDAILAGSTKYRLASLLLLAGGAYSCVSIWRLRAAERARLRLVASVLFDAVLVSGVLLLMVLWPHEGYVGLLREVEVGAYLLVVIAAGARLSAAAAAVGVAANAVGVAALLALDHALAGRSLAYGPADVALGAVLYLGACTFAWVAVRGTRWLVHEGSQAYALAEKARQRLGVYVSPEVAAKILEEGELELGGRRGEVAVLFSDLRGFTAYSEKIPPERLVAELNAYFDAMVQAIAREGGLIDKFIGDAIMALFGASGRDGDPSAAAIRAAAAMQEALAAHNAARAARGLPPLRQGVGVHFGPAVAGNIGTPERMQFTVVGDVVNTASRLESATKVQGVPVLISGDAVKGARASGEPLPELAPRGRLAIRGREGETEVFTLAGDRP